MKIVVTYESADISRLIRQDLARQGITATDADIKYTKSSAVVSVEVTADETQVPVVVEVAPLGTPLVAVPVLPALEVIEGGAGPVDMSNVLRASSKIAATTEGKFPSPKHNLLEGESTEWPGDKT